MKRNVLLIVLAVVTVSGCAWANAPTGDLTPIERGCNWIASAIAFHAIMAALFNK
jgi:hypothetical protein